MLSIIIPTLNAERELAATLEACAPAHAEIIVCDGGSNDRTSTIARSMGANLISSEPGRGTQLRTGAKAASGTWLLFLHADSIFEPGWEKTVTEFTGSACNRLHAGVFNFRLNDDTAQARRIERWVSRRTRYLALPYGDQGLLISREFYDTLGGYQPLPLMEDVDLIRRIGRKNLHVLPATLTTSAIRYQRHGYWKRPLFHLFLLSLYCLGVPPSALVRLYQ